MLTFVCISAWAMTVAVPIANSRTDTGARNAESMGQAVQAVKTRPDAPDAGAGYGLTQETGRLGAADLGKAIALIRETGGIFQELAARGPERPVTAAWNVIHETYQRAERTLRDLISEDRIKIADLPAGSAGAVVGGALTVDATLDGKWQPEAVRTKRKVGEGDWGGISRLAGVLFQQLALWDSPRHWAEWLDVHQRDAGFGALAVEDRSARLKPHLVSFWHIQDKQLANQLSGAIGGPRLANGRRTDRDIALHNEMLAALKDVEYAAGWSWRDRFETAWDDSRRHIQKLAAARGRADPAAGAEQAAGPRAPSETPGLDLEPSSAGVAVTPESPAAGTDELLELQREIKTLAEASQSRDAEIGAFRDLLESTGAKGDELLSRVEAQTAKLDAASEALSQTMRDLESLAELSARQARTEERLEELPTETALHGLGAKVQLLEGQLAGVPTRADQDGLHEEIGQLRSITKALPGRIKELEQAVASLAGDVGAVERAFTADRETADARRGDTQEIRRIQSNGERIESLRADLAGLREETVEIGKQFRAEVTKRQSILLMAAAAASILAVIAAVAILWRSRARNRQSRKAHPTTQTADPPEAARQDTAVAAPAMDEAKAKALRTGVDRLQAILERDRKQAGSLARGLGELALRRWPQ